MATVEAALPSAGGWRAWLLAARPRTWSVAVAPVMLGSALAAADSSFRALPAMAALIAAVWIQIGTNLANDWFDHRKGADAEDRIGPPRAMQLGLIPSRDMQRGIVLSFGVAALVGVYLIAVGGWPIALVGVLSIAAGVAYTGGPYPLGYHGLGDLAVFVFFGVVAVSGTYYVQALALPGLVVAASIPVAALATAVLVVNNIRDAPGDRRAGKRTLAVLLGVRAARSEYLVLICLPFAMLPLLAASGASPWIWLTLACSPLAMRLVRTVWQQSDGPSLNRALAGTAQLELVFCALLSLGWLL